MKGCTHLALAGSGAAHQIRFVGAGCSGYGDCATTTYACGTSHGVVFELVYLFCRSGIHGWYACLKSMRIRFDSEGRH